MSDTTTIEWKHVHEACGEPKSPGLDCPGFPTLRDRVDHMRQVLEQTFDQEPHEPADRVVEFLADLLHYCDEQGVNFHAALLRAEDHHAAESTPAKPAAPLSHHPASPGHHRAPRQLRRPLRPEVGGVCASCQKSYSHLGQHFRFNPTHKSKTTQS